ncbi:MAG: nitrogen fixation protein NifZ [Methylococcales bacterium]
MNVEDLDLGDVVHAAHTIIDDGSMPDSEEGAILAEQGSRGVIVMKGYVEEDPTRSVFLVRFEDKELNLGQPIGCWSEDLQMVETVM